VLTRIAAWVTEDPVLAADYLKHIPLNRFAETIDVAKAVLFLASSYSSYITGQTLVLDGGQTLGIQVDAPDTPLPGIERSGKGS
jgi:NAD(P)-dependent dehydrogenase (short-subunit alcohol dehydrogenase family)